MCALGPPVTCGSGDSDASIVYAGRPYLQLVFVRGAPWMPSGHPAPCVNFAFRQRLAIWSFTYTTRDSYATQCRDAWVPHTLNRILSYLTDKIRSDCWVSRRYTTRDATHNPARCLGPSHLSLSLNLYLILSLRDQRSDPRLFICGSSLISQIR